MLRLVVLWSVTRAQPVKAGCTGTGVGGGVGAAHTLASSLMVLPVPSIVPESPTKIAFAWLPAFLPTAELPWTNEPLIVTVSPTPMMPPPAEPSGAVALLQFSVELRTVTELPLDRTPPLYAAACLQWSGVGMLGRSIVKGHPGRSTQCGFNIFGTMPPDPSNFVALDTSRRGTHGTPGIVLNVRHPESSATALIAARDQLIALLDRTGLRPVQQQWFIDPVGGAVHYAGTCRMHESPQFGMLDRWSRLHAVPNVVVADSAAFTTGPEKNPVLTAMALSARASQRLVDDMKSGTI